MPDKSVRVITLGCSKNTVDTEHLLGLLQKDFKVFPEDSDPAYVDYLLLNTCGFIGDAKEESVQAILAAAALKEQGRVGSLIVFGCLSQRYAAELPSLIPEVDAWFGTRDLAPVARALGVEPGAGFGVERFVQGRGKGYAYLKISEGCDRRCSYCAIPHIRGPHRSVPVETLVREARMLASQGVKELILIAQDTTWYGLDIYGKRALADLLQSLSQVQGIEWLRIHYSYPADFPEDVLDQMASNPKVCKYMDIPLQHISDGVLGKMRRHIDSEGTRRLIRTIRERVPGVVLRTTMITGHPGEGEAEFQELMDFVKEARFERLGAFAYSEEEGTYGAEHFKDDVPQEEKQRRLEELMIAQKDISLAFNRSRVGSEEKVIVDDFANGVYICRSRFESPEVDGEILVSSPVPLETGQFVNVRITGADEYDLTAEII